MFVFFLLLFVWDTQYVLWNVASATLVGAGTGWLD